MYQHALGPTLLWHRFICFQVQGFDFLRHMSATTIALRRFVDTTFSVHIFAKSWIIGHQINYDLLEEL